MAGVSHMKTRPSRTLSVIETPSDQSSLASNFRIENPDHAEHCSDCTVAINYIEFRHIGIEIDMDEPGLLPSIAYTLPEIDAGSAQRMPTPAFRRVIATSRAISALE